MEGIFSNFRQNRRIPIKRKLEIIEYTKYHGNNEAAKFGGVCTKTIRKWRKNEEDFKNIQDPNKKITLHKGRFKAFDYEAEKQIYEWIAFNRSLGNAVTTWAFGVELLKKCPDKINIKPHSLLNCVYRFMQRFNLSIRKGSHIGQQLPSDSEDRIIRFLRSIILLGKKYKS